MSAFNHKVTSFLKCIWLSAPWKYHIKVSKCIPDTRAIFQFEIHEVGERFEIWWLESNRLTPLYCCTWYCPGFLDSLFYTVIISTFRSFVFQGWLCMYMQCCYAALNPCTWYWWFGTCRRDVVLLFHYLYVVAIDSKGLYKTFYFVIRLLSLVGLSNLR